MATPTTTTLQQRIVRVANQHMFYYGGGVGDVLQEAKRRHESLDVAMTRLNKEWRGLLRAKYRWCRVWEASPRIAVLKRRIDINRMVYATCWSHFQRLKAIIKSCELVDQPGGDCVVWLEQAEGVYPVSF